ncbi:MAG: 23S rRNA (uracil-5-)-methyltransferase RumA, partial [Latilactobacillus curvatus]|nr:23S rRNA (uracil-5-)-methyltransferase RumA [Latilactobacillus curvatus]
KETAARLGLDADRADFRCQDAGAAAAQLAAEGARPDVIVVDPPRKGCDEATLTAIAEMAPRTVVMVSCNAATAARDAKWLTEHGYKAVEVQPVDLFPRTKHVEVIVWLSRAK